MLVAGTESKHNRVRNLPLDGEKIFVRKIGYAKQSKVIFGMETIHKEEDEIGKKFPGYRRTLLIVVTVNCLSLPTNQV